MEDDEVLIPWYAPGRNFSKKGGTHSYTEYFYESYAKENNPKLKVEKPKPAVVKTPVEKPRTIVDRHVPDFGWSVNVFPKMEHAEVAAATRLALRGKRPFTLSDEGATAMLLPWFTGSKQRGLTDVAFVLKYQLDIRGLWSDREESAVLCWYRSGAVSKLTIQLADGLQYKEQLLSVGALRKPVCEDNLKAFREALLDIRSVACADWWAQLFMDAVHILESSHCTYEEKKLGFYLPEPYYKYLLAVRDTRLGAGMGSWYDLPNMGTTAFRLATHQLEYEKCRALLYAVNNC